MKEQLEILKKALLRTQAKVLRLEARIQKLEEGRGKDAKHKAAA